MVDRGCLEKERKITEILRIHSTEPLRRMVGRGQDGYESTQNDGRKKRQAEKKTGGKNRETA